MDIKTIQTIEKEFGKRATVSELERELYSRDLAPVPSLLVKPFFQTLPDIIVRPKNTSEVASLVKYTNYANIPVVPRAGGSTVFFNTVPVKGGLLMDLNLLKGVVKLNEGAKTVSVGAATTWEDLEKYLNSRNLACKSMPSSAPSATVGGWFNMMGYGIGSIKYGSLLSQVRSIEVVLPNGQIEMVTKDTYPPLEWYAASEGTLGVVTEIELEIRTMTKMIHYLIQISSIRHIKRVMQAVLNSKVQPFNVHISESQFIKRMKVLGFSDIDNGGSCLLAIDYEGSDEELSVAVKWMDDLLMSDNKIKLLPREAAEGEWHERFRSLRLKRGGPSLLGGEVLLPVTNIPAYLEDIEKMAAKYRLPLMSYGHVVSAKHATIMTVFYTNENKTVNYILDLSLVKKIQDVGYRHGGSPYGVGLWNTPYLNRIFSKPLLKEMRQRKKELDPKNMMNPGKLYKAPTVLTPSVFHLGMDVLAVIRRFFGKGR